MNKSDECVRQALKFIVSYGAKGIVFKYPVTIYPEGIRHDQYSITIGGLRFIESDRFPLGFYAEVCLSGQDQWLFDVCNAWTYLVGDIVNGRTEYTVSD